MQRTLKLDREVLRTLDAAATPAGWWPTSLTGTGVSTSGYVGTTGMSPAVAADK
jgi:hypothetical protein